MMPYSGKLAAFHIARFAVGRRAKVYTAAARPDNRACKVFAIEFIPGF
jgi:hypothetical protein